MANPGTVEKQWLVVDAEDLILGRMASEVAFLIRGKHKTSYTPHVDCGDNVIVINAEKIKLTGKKLDQKQYQNYSGHPGGRTLTTPRQYLAKNPTKIVERAVKGMLPKTKLGAALYRNLFVYAGNEHPHAAQSPSEHKI